MHESSDEHILEHLLADNNELAQHNREHFDKSGTFSINFMSAPGAGKTSLIEKSLASLLKSYRCSVIEGDMVGDLDATRLRKSGADVFQIATGRACHLDAKMVARLLHEDKIEESDCLLIENVGNLVCPAEFPLGEHKRIVLLSITEGDDKPLKYPVIFRNCDVVLFTKCDLLPYVNFDLAAAKKYVEDLNPKVKTFSVSIKESGDFASWMQWLENELKDYKKA
ncbi:MAG: hydrogenase accessory protein HypB [Candidatus Melainabacteria bacterium]|nr:MAG: hydrogenase accessory protein HypB [Candidatus Melainabacteria bacterium]